MARGQMVRLSCLATVLLLAVFAPQRTRADAACPGDCNGDGNVSIAEVITVIRMNFGELAVSACPNGAREPVGADNVDVVCALRNALFNTCQNCA